MGRSDGDDFVCDVGRMMARESTVANMSICFVARVGRRCRFVIVGGDPPDYVNDFDLSEWPGLLGDFAHNLEVFDRGLKGAIRR